ncbi:MAG: type III-A CRISPR-associated protein Csm2 [Clostridioides sp.]|jgi:CRISPR-associated protein Csm2|nr:type III-A CRISPR-associated protein Csm2 [Clostridioides sp.]
MVELFIAKSKKGTDIVINEKNFGSTAQEIIKKYKYEAEKGYYYYQGKKRIQKEKGEMISTSKIRGILDLVNKIYNEVFYSIEDKLTTKQVSDIAYLKVKLAYECGREKEEKRTDLEGKKIERIGVDLFIHKTGIMSALDEVIKEESREKFLLYARYVESLIAYFKFYGGKDK